MADKTYKIILADGTEIQNLTMNGDNYISKVEIDKGIFEDNCSTVIIDDGESRISHENMELVQVTKRNEEYWFVLKELSEDEIASTIYKKGIQYLATKTLSDTDALGAIFLFEEWSGNFEKYRTGDRRTYNNELYECLQDHTSQDSWTPDTAVSLWKKIADPSEEYPQWKQPTGAHDAYPKGSKVTHENKRWTSDIDANTYEPGVSNWTEKTE